MFELTPSGGPLGATVTGVDLRGELPAHVSIALRKAWLDHIVLVFPDQPLDGEQFLRFARTIGTPARYPFVDGIDGFPEIIEVKKLPDEQQNFGGIWHSDTVYLERPPIASMLLARTVPPTGGDTEFANQYLAYETLDEDVKHALDGRRAVNTSERASDIRVQGDRISEQDRAQAFIAEHPAVRTHEETNRKALFVNVAHTESLIGLSPSDSRQLLDHVFDHQVRSDFVWRLQWKPNMLAIWDNRCCLHNPINDYHGHLRLMHRITLEGSVPR